jgi:hypothetical protein
MNRLVIAVALLLVPSAAALPEDSRHFFPLQPRNEWTFENVRYGGAETLSVGRASPGVFRLIGFPGAGTMRVRWSGQTLQAWDGEDRRWEALLRLGAPVGTKYAVDLPQPLWSRVQVTVASRRAAFYNPRLRRRHSGTVRLSLLPNPDLADAGITDLWFAPRLGPVRWVEQSIAGPVEHLLARARIGRTTIGNGA